MKSKTDHVYFESRAFKRWAFWSHSNCKFIITNRGIVFVDEKDSSYSFNLPIEDIKNAIFTNPRGFLGSDSDLLIILKDGTEHEVGFDDGVKEKALKVINDIILIKNWNRNNLNYDTQNEAELNAVVTSIDNYTHYWGKQLKGDNWQNEDIYLLLVGGDREIPFYRKYVQGGPSTHTLPEWYGVTTRLEDAAKKDYMITNAIFMDTGKKADSWKKGTADQMFAGRILAEDAVNLVKFVENIKIMKGEYKGSTAIVATDVGEGEDVFRNDATKAKKLFEDVNYNVVDNVDNKPLIVPSGQTRDWNEEDINKVMTDSTDYWFFSGHGHNQKFGGDAIKYPVNCSLFMSACFTGLADRDVNKNNESIFVHSAIRNNNLSLVVPTSTITIKYSKDLFPTIIEQATGARDIWSLPPLKDQPPLPIGKALNKAKNSVKSDDMESYLGYLLYGAPWKKQSAVPSSSRSKYEFDNTVNTISSNVRKLREAAFSKIITENITQYQITMLNEFDQVQIENYNQLMEGVLTTPVVPVRTVKVVLPDDAAVTAVNLTRADEIPLGVLNLPAFHDFAPIEGVDAPDVFQTAPDSIGLFNTTHRWFEIDEGKYKTVVIDVFPVSYDVVSDEATLYKNLTVEVEYNTQTKGVQVSSGPEKVNYTIGENIDVSTVVSNITDQDQNYTITTNLVSALNGTVVDTDTQSLNVPAGEEGETTLSLTPSLKGGGYWVKVAGKDNAGNSIGDTTEHIKASAGSITNFKVSEVIPDNNAVFEVTFSNQNAQTTNAQFGVAIYKGTLQVADFVPVAYDMASGIEQTAVFTWKVPTDFQFGQYMAVATVRAGDDTISASQNFEVGQLGGLTHLILTDKSAPMNIPSFANIIVTGSYQANTIKIATGAQVEFQNFVGANVLIFEESSSQFTAYRSGAMLYLTSSNETKIQIAAKTTLQSFYFADGKSDFVITNGKVMLGNQEITTTSTEVTNPGNNEQAPNTQITTLPESINTYLLLTDTSIPLSIPKGAYIRVTGSSGANTINVESGGRAALENFVGSNIVNIQDVSTGFKIYHSGATVYLNNTSTGTMIIISAKSTAQTFRFANGGSNLFISNNKIMIGGQEVTTNETQLVNPTNTGDTSDGIF